jgi:hypothetical protein
MAEDQLKRFGDALANSASALFEGDEKEVFVRILRDLSVQDLETLNHDKLLPRRLDCRSHPPLVL